MALVEASDLGEGDRERGGLKERKEPMDLL
jgi:hypothetical protein